MKYLKKTTALLLSVLLLFSAMVTGATVLADGNTATITAAQVEAEAGANVDVAVTVNTTGLAAAEFTVDVDGLTVNSATVGESFTELAKDELTFVVVSAADADVTGEVVLVTLNVAVPADAAEGTVYDITVSDVVAADWAETDVEAIVEAGTVTVKASTPEEPTLDTGITFKHALNLASDIAITFRVPVENLAGYDMDTVYAEIYRDIYTFGDSPVKSYSEKVQVDWVLANDGRYDFKYSGLTAREMFADVYCVVYGEKDGVLYCSTEDVYAVKDWCLSASRSSKATTRQLGATLAYYGESAQNYKNYCKNNLVSGGEMAQYMTNRLVVDMTTYTDGKFETSNPSGVNASTKWSRALMLDNILGLNCIVDLNSTYASRYQELSMKITYASDDDGAIDKDFALNDYSSTKRFNLEYYGLKSYEFDEDVTFAVYDGATQVTSSFTTSINDWCAAAYANYVGKTTETALKTIPLASAIVAYNECAEIYFNKVD